MQKVRAKIRLNDIRSNAEAFSALTGKRLCAVVKANAYGHGAEEVTCALVGIADCFAVALIEEGIAIRTAACGKDILVFTPPITEEECYALASGGFIGSIPDLRTAKLLSAVCKKYRLPARVHLKVNTGMNRYGMHASMLGKVCKFLQKDSFVRVEGIYSHLYDCAREASEKQRALFLRMLHICRRYYPDAIAHLSATYGSLLGEDFAFDMVRIGIGLYGYLPQGLSESETAQGKVLGLRKAMTVYAAAIGERKFSYGGIGYGKPCAVSETEKPKRLTVCRFGYADGFLRRRDNGTDGAETNANALCMDVCIRKGGKGGKRRGQLVPIMTDADEVARKTGTISYEVLCAATRRAEFVYEYE